MKTHSAWPDDKLRTNGLIVEDKSISNAEFDAKQRDQRVLMNRAREYERLRLIKNHPDFKPDQHFRAGQTFPSRIDLWVCGIHGRQMGSVAGNKKSGLQSVLLTNCPGNIDLGGVIIYQGPGFTSFCSQNQAFVDASRHPASKLIARACLDQRAFRLLRGANRASPYAPSEGFRYDGKYLCMLYWLEQHDRGLGWRFLFVRAPGEPTARWTQRETRVQVQV
ncbi:PUA-like domain-containing protein [Gaertneriomyces semiglobifer]|nr:PUA-like domain-containing protein [Gaertneriomyces semiglobifer]